MTRTSLGRSDVSFGWDRNHEPLVVVPSGTTVTLDAPECSNGQMGPDATLETFVGMDFSQLDPISGPIFVEGAQPGDVLMVEVLELVPGAYGWSANYENTGLLTHDFPDPWLKVWDLSGGGRAEYLPGISVPIEPMIGIAGCTPAASGPHPSVPPHRGGGNMDMKYLRVGTTAYLPVEVEGAFFGIGDPHAAQGDGEVGGAGIEAPMELTVRLSVVRDRVLRTPEYEVSGPLERASAAAAGYYVTTGIGPDLFRCAQDAVRAMVDRIVASYGIEPIEAYMLCSVAMDLKIGEAVNDPQHVVTAFLPKDLFH